MSFGIFQNEKTLFQSLKTRGSNSQKIDIFPKGLSHGFGPKMAIFPTFWGGGAIKARKMSFTIFQNKKTPSQAIKTRSSNVEKLTFFQRGQPMVLVQNWPFFHFFFWQYSRSLDLQIDGSIDRWIGRSLYRYISGSVDRWICRSLDRQIPGSVDLWIGRSLDLQIDGSVDRWICRSLVRQIAGSVDRWIGRSMKLQIARSVDHWICRSLDRQIDGSVDRWICRSLNRQIPGSVDRWIGRSLDL